MTEKKPSEYLNKGLHKYGHVKFADPINNKYPIDNEEHIRAAWSYIHIPRDFKNYTEEDLDIIKKRIISAWREKVHPEGPPGITDKKHKH